MFCAEGRSDRYGFSVILFGALAIPVFFLPLTPQDPFLLPKEALFSSVACCLVALIFSYGRPVGPPARLIAAAFLFVAAIAASLPGSANLHEGTVELRRWIYLLIVFFSSMRICWSSARIRKLMSASVAVGGLVSLYALLEYLQLFPFPSYPFTDGRLYCFFGHQNIMGQYLAVMLLWGIALSADAGSRNSRGIFLLLSFIIASALFVSFCRAAIIAAGLSSCIFISHLAMTGSFKKKQDQSAGHRRTRWLLLPLVMPALLACLAVLRSEKTAHLLSDAFSRGDSYRLIIWKDTAEMIAGSPVRGVGLGNFQIVYPRYETGDFPWLTLYAYNEFLHMLAETGIIGLCGSAVFLLCVIAIIRGKAPAWMASADRVPVLGIFYGCLATGLQGMVSYDLHSPASAYLLFAGLGILCAGPPEGAAAPTQSPGKGAAVATCLAVIVSLAGMTGEYRRMAGHYFEGRAVVADKADDVRQGIAFSQKAIRYQPFDPEYHYLLARQYLEASRPTLAAEQVLDAKKLSPYRFGGTSAMSGQSDTKSPGDNKTSSLL